MLDRKLSGQLYEMVFVLDSMNVEVEQHGASLLVNDEKNLVFIWRYKQHMHRDLSKILLELLLRKHNIVTL